VDLKQRLNELDADLANGTLAPESYEQSRMELEKRLRKETEDGPATPAPVVNRGARRLVLAVTIGLLAPLLAVAVHFVASKSRVVETKAPAMAADSASGAAHPTTQEQVQVMVARLAARLEKNPQDADGWAMLGRSYTTLRRFDDGAAAFAKAEALRPRNARLQADHADTVAMAQGKRFDGLNAAPLVADARVGKSAQVPATRDKPGHVHAAATVKGRVRVIAELADKTSPTDTVFIIARAVDGPAMPLAVLKRQAKDLPLDFALDDTMAISPDAKLSKFKLVDVAARISKSGNVTTQSGDLLSPPVRATVGGPNVELPIRGMMR
jgi:cytochrome c-type biogenesis protein CcmH